MEEQFPKDEKSLDIIKLKLNTSERFREVENTITDLLLTYDIKLTIEASCHYELIMVHTSLTCKTIFSQNLTSKNVIRAL